MDLTKFFESLTQEDLHGLWERHPQLVRDWTDADRHWFTHIVCHRGRLTIGAPTSPKLSNSLCFDLDESLVSAAEDREVTYTRYADDLFFSSGEPNLLGRFEHQVTDIIEASNWPGAISLNRRKTFHGSARGRLAVTGIILTPEGGLSVGRKLKRRVRSMIVGYTDLDAVEQAQLAGLLAYIQSVEPDTINRLYIKYGAARMDQAFQMPPLDTQSTEVKKQTGQPAADLIAKIKKRLRELRASKD